MNKEPEKDLQGKPIKASPVNYQIKKAVLYFLTGSLILGGLFSFILQYAKEPQIYVGIIDATTESLLVSVDVKVGDEIAFHWIHSVEHISWVEHFIIDQHLNLMLYEIRFQGFGAGIPHEKGKELIFEDGFIIMRDIGEIFPVYNWIHSQTATEKITLNGDIIIEGKDLPHHSYMKLVIQER